MTREPKIAAATVGGAITAAAARLAASGIAEPRREARLILGLALGVDPGELLAWPDRALDAADGDTQRIRRRRLGEAP